MICAVGLGWLARRCKFPYPTALAVGGELIRLWRENRIGDEVMGDPEELLDSRDARL